jgi:hypothetical protein
MAWMRCTLALLLCLGLSQAAAAQAVDHAILRLRDISVLLVSVAFLPDARGGGPCLMGRAALEEHAADTLSAAGLQAVTGAEAFRRAMEQLRLSQAEVRALQQRRPLPALDADEHRRRMAEHKFLQNTPGLSIAFHATPHESAETTLCAVAVSGRFLARPADDTALAVNGREVRAPLSLWQRDARSFLVRDGELVGSVTEQLDTVLGAFLTDWRRANGR